MIKIGDKSYRTSRPSDLDKQLLELTGCSTEEVCEQLRSGTIASGVASALLPFMGTDAPHRAELAEEIVAAGIDDVRRDALALYEKAGETDEPAKTAEKGSSQKG